jgi:hypothetical protein
MLRLSPFRPRYITSNEGSPSLASAVAAYSWSLRSQMGPGLASPAAQPWDHATLLQYLLVLLPPNLMPLKLTIVLRFGAPRPDGWGMQMLARHTAPCIALVVLNLRILGLAPCRTEPDPGTTA